MGRQNDTKIGRGIIVVDCDGIPYTAESFVEAFGGTIRKAILYTVGRRETPRFSTEDIIQDVTYRILQSVGRYEPERQISLKFYISQRASFEARKFLRDHSHNLKIVRSVRECGTRIRNRYDKAEWAEREHDLEQTALELEFPVSVVKETFAYLREGEGVYSLQRPVMVDHEGRDITLMETVVAPQADEEKEFLLGLIHTYFLEVSEKERILLVGYLEKIPQTRLAEHFGCSQMHISRLQRRALDQMRTVLNKRRQLYE